MIIERIVKNKWKIIVFSVVLWQWNFSSIAYAYAEPKEEVLSAAPITRKIYTVEYKKKIAITAYSSTVDQCDSTPCITANGYNLCKNNREDVVATNFLPFGTKIRIPSVYGDRIFIVQDRMNKRYYYRADVWMQTRQKAIKFGLKNTEIEVLSCEYDEGCES